MTQFKCKISDDVHRGVSQDPRGRSVRFRGARGKDHSDSDTLGSDRWATKKGLDTASWSKSGGRWLLEQLRMLTDWTYPEHWWQRMPIIQNIQWSKNRTKKWTLSFFLLRKFKLNRKMLCPANDSIWCWRNVIKVLLVVLSKLCLQKALFIIQHLKNHHTQKLP